MVRYGEVILSLKSENDAPQVKTRVDKIIKEKNNTIKEFQKVNKNLVDKLSKQQHNSKEENFKKVNDSLAATKSELKKAKETLEEAHESGALKQAFFELSDVQQSELRDFANELKRTS